MIKFTPDEFEKVRDSIALAHLLIQSLAPMLKQRHSYLNREQRTLLDAAPRTLGDAFAIIAAITHREGRDLNSGDEPPVTKITDIDQLLLRDELENVSALVLPDLVNEMKLVLALLPMYKQEAFSIRADEMPPDRLMAWTWEAGRRYGVQQAIAIIDSCSTEFREGVCSVLGQALDGNLDLPSPELPFPAATDATGDAATVEGAAVDHEASKVLPFTYEPAS
jgi:hypothetical protein